MADDNDRADNLRKKIQAARDAQGGYLASGAAGEANRRAASGGGGGSSGGSGGSGGFVTFTDSQGNTVSIQSFGRSSADVIATHEASLGTMRGSSKSMQLGQKPKINDQMPQSRKDLFKSGRPEPEAPFTPRYRRVGESRRFTTVDLSTVPVEQPKPKKAPIGDIQEATFLQKAAIRQQENPINKFFSGFKTALFNPSQAGTTLRTGGKSETAGALGGVLLGIVPAGRAEQAAAAAAQKTQAAKTAFQASRAGQISKKALEGYKAFRNTIPGRFAEGFGTAVAETEAIRGGIRLAEKKKEKKYGIPFDTAVRKQFEATEAAIDQAGGVKIPLSTAPGAKIGSFSPRSLLFDISTLTAPKGAKQKGKEEVRKLLKERGFTGQRLEDAVSQVEKAAKTRGIGEAAALVNIERIGEATGLPLFTSFFKKQVAKGAKETTETIGTTLFKRGFIQTAPLGFTEAFVGLQEQRLFRGQTFEEVTTPKALRSAAIAGGIGAGTAGIFGGGIPALRGKQSKLATPVEFTGQALDFPFELAGDIAEAQARKVKRFFGFDIPEPTLNIAGGRARAVTFGITPSRTETATKTTQTKRNRVATVDFGTVTKPGVPSETFVPADRSPIKSIDDLIGTPSKTPTDTGGRTGTNAFGIVTLPGQTPTQPIIPEINIGVPTTTTTTTPANTFVNIPSISPQPRFLPPLLPPVFPFGAAGSGTAKRKKKKFVNELQASQDLLGNLLFGRPLSPQPSRKKAKKRRRKK